MVALSLRREDSRIAETHCVKSKEGIANSLIKKLHFHPALRDQKRIDK
jgi:hypothetical protein